MTQFQWIKKIQFIIMIYVSWSVQSTVSLVHFPPKERFHVEGLYWEDILSVFKSPLIQTITKRWAKQSWRLAVASAAGSLYHYSTCSRGKRSSKTVDIAFGLTWTDFKIFITTMLLCSRVKAINFLTFFYDRKPRLLLTWQPFLTHAIYVNSLSEAMHLGCCKRHWFNSRKSCWIWAQL